MKAIIQTEYGTADVLKLVEMDKPAPGPTEVLVKIEATSLNAYDWHLMRAEPFIVRLSMGFSKPNNPIRGADIAGVVEAVGPEVTEFRVGDAVYGDLSATGGGGLAEYAAVPESALAPMPEGFTFEQAAAVPMAALTALQGLRDAGKLKPGMKVLIHGASGGVGTFAVQIAKLMGAEVTAVCSTSKVELARKLGADHVIDYKKEDFTRNGEQYDLILGVNGNRSLSEYAGSLAPGGRYVMAGGTNKQIFEAVLMGAIKSRTSGRTLTNVSAKPNPDDLKLMNEWMVAGKVQPVIDRCYPLEEAADAMHYIDAGHATGKVIVTMNGASDTRK